MSSVVVFDMKKSPLVVQSNKLVEARYSMTAGETKLVFAMISAINANDSELSEYTFKISNLASLLNINSKNIYRETEKYLFKLQDRVIHIPEEEGYFRTHWIAGIRRRRGYVSLSFHKDLKPYLIKLKEKFTKFRLSAITSFQGAYTIRIYMMLKQYEAIGWREIELSEFREYLEIPEEKYTRFADFRKRVLDQAKKEFEKKNKPQGYYNSDITFDLETIRTGRKITSLRFLIKKQAYQEILPLELPEPEVESPAVLSLTKHGITESVAKKFVEEQGEDDILRCVCLYEEALKAGKVKNKSGGYLIKMLQAKAGQITEAEKQAEVKKKEKAEAQRREEKKKALEEKKRELEKEFRIKAVSDFIATLSENEADDLLEEARSESPLLRTSIKSLDSSMCLGFLLPKIPDFEKNQKAYVQKKMK